MSGKLQDKLTGRAKEFEVLPFTFSEYVEFKQVNHLPIDYDEDFGDFLKLGGMPQRFNENNEMEARRYLKGIFDSIIEKDVFRTHKKINKNEFKRVANYVLSESGKTILLNVGCQSFGKRHNQRRSKIEIDND